MRPAFKRLSALPVPVTAKYLVDYYPQATAVVLSELRPWRAIQILMALPPEYRAEVVQRMLRMLRPMPWVIDLAAESVAEDLPRLEQRQPAARWWVRIAAPWLDPYHRARRGF